MPAFAGFGLILWRADRGSVADLGADLDRTLREALEPAGWVMAGPWFVTNPHGFQIAMDDWNRLVRRENEGEVWERPWADVRDVAEYYPEEDPRQGESAFGYEEGDRP